MSFNRLWDQIQDDLGCNNVNMLRSRPYRGQPHTCTGERGKTEIKGITFRDLRDCFIRAVFLSAAHIKPIHYAEAEKGEHAALNEKDLYGWDFNELDPIAIVQNLSCEIERIMGIFPNIPPLSEDPMADIPIYNLKLPNPPEEPK